ncbi:MAG TPA: universal stress protein [Chloroflexota bacterium]|jgi:nucleotide-binding universal stress UspA family protein|nr:universal stress protein [Chloroflexota bacterium]
MANRDDSPIQARRILVPVNGNPTDHDMVTLACQIGRANRGEVHAIYIIEVKRSLPLDADLPQEATRGEEVLDRAEEIAGELDETIQTELLQARDVGTAIVDEAINREADLILLGINYEKRFGEFSMGKTVPYVLKNAPCRVWICRQAIA